MASVTALNLFPDDQSSLRKLRSGCGPPGSSHVSEHRRVRSPGCISAALSIFISPSCSLPGVQRICPARGDAVPCWPGVSPTCPRVRARSHVSTAAQFTFLIKGEPFEIVRQDFYYCLRFAIPAGGFAARQFCVSAGLARGSGSGPVPGRSLEGEVLFVCPAAGLGVPGSVPGVSRLLWESLWMVSVSHTATLSGRWRIFTRPFQDACGACAAVLL